MARLGALSVASVSTPISLSFCPALLSEDKRQAVNFHGSHGLAFAHTLMDGLSFLASSKTVFKAEWIWVDSLLLIREQDTQCAHSGERSERCVWVFSRGLIEKLFGFDRRREENGLVAFFGFELHSEVLPCVPLYKYSSSLAFCINSWNTFIYLNFQFQKVDHSWVVNSITVLAEGLTLLQSSPQCLLLEWFITVY